MGISPFFMTQGYNLLIAIHPDAEVTDLQAKHFAVNFDKVHHFLCDHMSDTQETMHKYADQDRIAPPPFRIGDRVYVHTDHICTNRTARKLAEKKIGLFSVIAQPSPMSFTLHLPSTIRIHPVFHISQLKPKDPNTFEDCDQPPPPPLIIDGDLQYLIERIIDSKYNHTRCKCQLLYHVKWTGYLISNNATNWILANAFDDEAG